MKKTMTETKFIKKIVTAAVMVLMTVSMSAAAFAGSNISLAEAEKIALKDAYQTKAKVYDISYDVEILAPTGAVIEYEKKYRK